MTTINDRILDNEKFIKLTGDTEECVYIPPNHVVTIDLNGYTLTNNDMEYTIVNRGTLNITDSVGTGAIHNDAPLKGCILNRKEGVMSINGGSYVLNRSKAEAWYYIVNLGSIMTINRANVIGTSPHASTVRNGFYTAQETQEDYTGEDVRMIINGGTFTGQLIPVKNDNHGDLVINGGSFEGTSECVLNWNMCEINGGTFTSPTGKYVIFSGSCAGELGCNGQLDVNGGTFTGGSAIKDLSPIYDPNHTYPDSYAYIDGGNWNLEDPESIQPFVKPGYTLEIDDHGKATVIVAKEWEFPEGGSSGMGLSGMKRIVMHNETVEYEEGGFELPIRGFEPICVIGAMAEGGLDAYYNRETKKLMFYRNGNEVSGKRLRDVTIIMVG